ncbi:hypothetical protein [Enterococcus sp. RTP21361st1_A6_RTP21361_211029]|uniref:hypothetical protein n=1 Tax=Enterococcus sp. RTP21361st1_A6_RTP21361_211029 TaxID=3143199 RepID=UPI0034A39D90
MTYVRNYMTCGRSGSSGNITESPLGTLSLAAVPEDGQSEVFAQWAGIPIPEPGVWVIAARCRQATPPGSGVQNPLNGVLPVWSGNFVQMLNRGQAVLEAKNYAYEFTVPEGTETLTWRVCAPSGGSVIWDHLYIGPKTDWQQLKALDLDWFRGDMMPMP